MTKKVWNKIQKRLEKGTTYYGGKVLSVNPDWKTYHGILKLEFEGEYVTITYREYVWHSNLKKWNGYDIIETSNSVTLHRKNVVYIRESHGLTVSEWEKEQERILKQKQHLIKKRGGYV